MSKTDPPPAIVWFRRDLRLADHPALCAAIAEGGRVLPVFVLDDEEQPWRVGGAARWWLHQSLAALAAALEGLGAPLLLRRGPARRIIPELARAVGATRVHAGLLSEPAARAADEDIAATLAASGGALVLHRAATLFEPDAIRTKAGGVYGVYTPFANACRARGEPERPLDAPHRLDAVAEQRGDDLSDWRLLPTRPDWAGGLREAWTPGEASAQARLREWTRTHLDDYASGRNLPGQDLTSRLSPHLHWGELSPAQVWHASRAAGGGAGGDAFRGEILWHEFAAYLLWNNPELPDAPLRRAFAGLAWRDDPAALRAWQKGRTGVPIVDAGMRQLWHMGWMHNRVRMITGSFLTKHLLIPWQQGEAWFWDTLVDADLATNAASWQWVAGSGTDAQPFFRVFNPVLQGRKFDPDGAYVRRWVPELARLPSRHLHAPWEAPAAVLDQAGLRLGRDYPAPIVPLGAGRDRALAAFRALRGAAE